MDEDIAKWVDELMTAGCMPKVAARVVTQAFVAGMAAAPNRDPAAERRRAWDREYRRKRNKSGGSGGKRVELEPTQWLWTEGQGLLRQLGIREQLARSNIGRWLKAGNDPATVKQLIVEVHQKGIGDPIPWVTKALGNAKGQVNGTGPRGGRQGSPAGDFFAGIAEVAANIGGDGPVAGPGPEDIPRGRVEIDG